MLVEKVEREKRKGVRCPELKVVSFGRLEAGASRVPGFGEVIWLSMIGSELVVGAKIREAAVIDLEKAMAPHSSTLAWKLSWTEEPGGLQSMGSLGVGHD